MLISFMLINDVARCIYASLFANSGPTMHLCIIASNYATPLQLFFFYFFAFHFKIQKCDQVWYCIRLPLVNVLLYVSVSETSIRLKNTFRRCIDEYLPDIKTASYCPRPAAITRCFNLFKDGRTSKEGISGIDTITFQCRVRYIANPKRSRMKAKKNFIFILFMLLKINYIACIIQVYQEC